MGTPGVQQSILSLFFSYLPLAVPTAAPSTATYRDYPPTTSQSNLYLPKPIRNPARLTRSLEQYVFNAARASKYGERVCVCVHDLNS